MLATARRQRTMLVAAAILIAVVAACSPAPAASPSSPTETPEPVPSEIAYAIHQREVFGLRSDREWVEQVAADPRATTFTLDFPMLPEEDAEFTRRQVDFGTVAAAVKAYAQTVPEAYGGVYIDQPRHVVVALWTATPEMHRVRVLERLAGWAPLEVRQVRHTEQELDDLVDRIGSDWDWMKGAGALPLSAGTEIIDNLVSLQVSSANPAIGAQILLHYGVGPDILRVDSDGSGVFLLPRGTIEGTVVMAGGKPVPGRNELMLQWEADGPGECGVGDMGYGVGTGRFELPCSPGGWTILVMTPVPDGWEEVGRGHVVVPHRGTVELRITLEPGARVRT